MSGPAAFYRKLRRYLERHPLLYGVLVFIILSSVSIAVAVRFSQYTSAEERLLARQVGRSFASRVELTLRAGLSATQSLALLVENGMLMSHFDSIAPRIMTVYPVLDAVELAPGGVVAHVHPYERNRSALGFDILNDPVQRREARLAVKERRLVFAGPLRLRQGGLGVVGRLPVFRREGASDRFWGFSLVVITIDRLLEESNARDITGKGYEYRLQRYVGNDPAPELFSSLDRPLVDPEVVPVHVPNGRWELLIEPTNGWNGPQAGIPAAVVGTLLSFVLGLFVWYVGRQPQKLSRLVEERTAELLSEEESYRELFNAVPDAIYLLDGTGAFIDVNDGAVEMYGYQRHEFVGRTPAFLSAPGQNDGFDLAGVIRRTMEGTPQQFEFWGLRKDGSVFPKDVRTFRVTYGGRPVVIAIAQDITERRRAEDEVRKNQRRLKRAEDVAMVGNWEFTLGEEVMRASDGARRIYGVEDLRLPLSVAQSMPLPEYRPSLDAALRDLIQNNTPYEVEFKVRRADDGRIIDVYSRAEYDPATRTVFGIIQDITERKKADEELRQSEERNRALVESLPDILFVHDREGRFVDCHTPDPGSLLMPPAEFMGRRYDQVLPPWLIEIVRPKFAESLNGGVVQYEYSAPSASGTRYYEARMLAFGNDRVLNIIRDVTDRVTAQNELRRMNAELERTVEERTRQLTGTNQELEAFVYSVSHDLRSPIRSIDAFTATFLEDHGSALAPEAHRKLGVVRSSAQKMENFIAALLNLSRVGGSELRLGRIDMEHMARSIAAECSSEDRRCAFTFLPMPAAFADEVMVRLVWTNLISNAVKYSARAENPAVEIGGRTDGGTAVYWVRDNGVGFDPKRAEKLFGVFQRLHTDAEFSGTGIGLSIVKRIVHRHGGSVTGEGEEGKGAVFTFTLPMPDGEEHRTAQKENHTQVSGFGPAGREGD